MTEAASLPAEFADLAPHMAWALATEGARNARRRAATLAELQAYYNAMLPRMRAVIAHLNTFPLDNLPPPQRNLLYLALSFMEAAMSVEVFKEPDETGAFPPDRYLIR